MEEVARWPWRSFPSEAAPVVAAVAAAVAAVAAAVAAAAGCSYSMSRAQEDATGRGSSPPGDFEKRKWPKVEADQLIARMACVRVDEDGRKVYPVSGRFEVAASFGQRGFHADAEGSIQSLIGAVALETHQ